MKFCVVSRAMGMFSAQIFGRLIIHEIRYDIEDTGSVFLSEIEE